MARGMTEQNKKSNSCTAVEEIRSNGEMHTQYINGRRVCQDDELAKDADIGREYLLNPVEEAILHTYRFMLHGGADEAVVYSYDKESVEYMIHGSRGDGVVVIDIGKTENA